MKNRSECISDSRIFYDLIIFLYQGIIPRAIRQIFEEIAERKRKDAGLRIKVMVSFLEIYNEEIKDLLDHQPTMNGKAKAITLRENVNGSIQVATAR
jgi:hypothetical protein